MAYVHEKGEYPFLLIKEEFDSLIRGGWFTDGPYRDNLGSQVGEPYNPNRQAFGMLADGRVVYCELSPEMQEKARAHLDFLRESIWM